MEKIIKRNFEYYKNHVLGKYYVFTTNKNESIIVKTSPENLAHLLGIKYATQNGLFRYSGTRFFREMQVYKNGVPPFVGIYDLIDAEKDKKDILSQEELWCKNKNKIFIELFENLNQGFHNVKIYRNINKRDFKANYLQIKILDDEYYDIYISMGMIQMIILNLIQLFLTMVKKMIRVIISRLKNLK